MINLKSILDDLKCSICLDFYSDPRTIGCQHSFCLKCIKPVAKFNHNTRVYSLDCPQCRKGFGFDTYDSLPKNVLLANLINTVNMSPKAACPVCKTTADLTVCDHCSQIFCHDCNDNHIKKTFDTFNEKITNIEKISEKFSQTKAAVSLDEQTAYKDVIRKMDLIQTKIFSLWQSRKINFINEIRQFYKSKSDEMEVAEFRWKIMSKHLEDLQTKKEELEKKYFQTNVTNGTTNISSTRTQNKELIKEFSDLEKEIESLEQKFIESFSKFNINSNRLKVTYNEMDTMEVFVKLIESIKLEAESVNDQRFLETKRHNQIELKDLFGRILCVLSESGKTFKIEDLKQKAQFQTGVNSKFMKLIDKNDFTELDNSTELLFEHNKWYLKTPESYKEIEIYLSYIYPERK